MFDDDRFACPQRSTADLVTVGNPHLVVVDEFDADQPEFVCEAHGQAAVHGRSDDAAGSEQFRHSLGGGGLPIPRESAGRFVLGRIADLELDAMEEGVVVGRNAHHQPCRLAIAHAVTILHLLCIGHRVQQPS